MAVRGVYRSAKPASLHAHTLFHRKHVRAQLSADYQAVRSAVKQEYLDMLLFTIFFAAAIEFVVIAAVIIYRLANGESAITPGCYLDQFLRRVFSVK